jgi:septal ring factor EnvC (AmiA/AmiB activator)
MQRSARVGASREFRRRAQRAFFGVAVLCVVHANVTHADVEDSLQVYEERIETQEEQLNQLRQKISELRKRDAELRKEEVGTLKQLKILDQDVSFTTDLLRELESKRERLEAQLAGIRAEHARAEEILAERRERLARTLRAMYVNGSANAAEVLLRTSNLREALTRFKYLGMVARNNERLFLEIRQQEVYLASTQAELTEHLSEVSSTASETQEERRRLSENRRLRQTTLSRMRDERGEHQKMLEDLALTEARLQGLLSDLEARHEALLKAGAAAELRGDGFAALRGAMSWPVLGPVVSYFGPQRHAKYATVTYNSGIDIIAQEGEPVHAVAGGRVEYVSWLDGYGRTVILNHGGGFYTVYAHLSEVMVLERQEVEAGHVLARVGQTGSLEGARLHFEVRNKAQAVDPLKWLVR